MKKAIEIKGKRHFTAEYAENTEKNKNVGGKMKDERQKAKDIGRACLPAGRDMRR